MNRSFVRTAACTLAAAAVTAVLLAVPASTPSQAASFTLSDPNCSSFTWDGVSTLTCVSSGGGGGALSCPIQASVGSPTVSQAVTLTANCSGGTAPYSYAWVTNGGPAGCPAFTGGTSTNAAALAVPGGATALTACSYKLTATDSASGSVSPTKNVSYSVSGGGGGGGGGGGNISCNGFSATHVINAAWTANGLYYTVNAGGFGPNDAIVVVFTTSSVTTSTSRGSFNAVEFSDPPTPRYGALSDTACDFSNGLAVAGGGRTAFSGDVGASAYFSVLNKKTAAATLQPNTTYYINLANMPGACSASCNMQITFSKPSGS